MTDFDTGRDQYDNYRFCYDNGHEEWLQTAKICFDFWRGKQWDQLIKTQLEREGRPALTLNVIESLIRALAGMQCALRNDVRFLPSFDANVASARVQDAVWLHIQQQNMLDFLETDVYKKGLIMNRAYYDVRVDYNDSINGTVVISSPRSQDILLDPSVDTYDPKTWPQVLKRRWVSYRDIEQMYGKEKADAVGMNPLPSWYDYEDQFMAQQMGNMPYYRFEGLTQTDMVRGHLLVDRQYATTKMKDLFIDVETGDTSEVPETWDRERISHVLANTPGLDVIKRKVRTIRWVVTCDGEVMHDADSPYKNFTIIPYFPSFLDGVSIGAVEALLDPQSLYNKMTSQELHIINTTANSGLIVKRNSVKNMTVEEMEEFGSKSGVVFEVDNVEDVKKITPNQTPQGHDRLSFKADQIMRQLAGVSDQGRGFAREDVAGKAILANQAAQDINSADWLSNLHRTKQLVAHAALDCVQAHYTETRVIQINRGSVYKPNMEEIVINQPGDEGQMLNDVTRGRYTSTLVPAPSRSTIGEADFKMLLEMRKLGIGIDDALLIELSPAANKEKIIESLRGDSNERQQQADQLALQQQQIDAEMALADTEKKRASATLDQARAEKAAIEAQIDPDAAYERVENARIEAELEKTRGDHALRRRELDQQDRHHAQDTALEVTKMETQKETAIAVAKEKPAATGDKKPGANKPKKVNAK